MPRTHASLCGSGRCSGSTVVASLCGSVGHGRCCIAFTVCVAAGPSSSAYWLWHTGVSTLHANAHPRYPLLHGSLLTGRREGCCQGTTETSATADTCSRSACTSPSACVAAAAAGCSTCVDAGRSCSSGNGRRGASSRGCTCACRAA